MNAQDKFLATAAKVDEAAVKPLPNSPQDLCGGFSSGHPGAHA